MLPGLGWLSKSVELQCTEYSVGMETLEGPGLGKFILMLCGTFYVDGQSLCGRPQLQGLQSDSK